MRAKLFRAFMVLLHFALMVFWGFAIKQEESTAVYVFQLLLFGTSAVILAFMFQDIVRHHRAKRRSRNTHDHLSEYYDWLLKHPIKFVVPISQETIVDEAELKDKVSPMKESDIVTQKQLNNLVSNGGFKATQSWGGNEPMVTEPAWVSQIPKRERLFYRGVPIVEQLEKILATQDMNALRELIDGLKKVGG